MITMFPLTFSPASLKIRMCQISPEHRAHIFSILSDQSGTVKAERSYWEPCRRRNPASTDFIICIPKTASGRFSRLFSRNRYRRPKTTGDCLFSGIKSRSGMFWQAAIYAARMTRPSVIRFRITSVILYSAQKSAVYLRPAKQPTDCIPRYVKTVHIWKQSVCRQRVRQTEAAGRLKN
jgi:hypothetical protein